MNKCIIILGFLSIAYIALAQNVYTVIPYPNSIVEKEGFFEFKADLTTTFPAVFAPEFELLNSFFMDEYKVKLISSGNGKLEVMQNKSLCEEAYKLYIDETKIIVEAASGAGCFYAFQTIRQLMKLTGDGSYTLAACLIEDEPEFSWRGFLLDEARNFKGKAAVKVILDQMALLKMNKFHWHLTDDQGWRIEIKKYPLLAEIGAWRDSTNITTDETGWSSPVYDPHPHGGYYSQNDIKEIVSYAANRHITIVPEIDLPGHSMAAIAAYPWLGTLGDTVRVRNSVGDITPGTLNIADERVFQFIEDVMDEIMTLFPGNIIHSGGDETDYGPWKHSKAANELMKKKKLNNYSDLQMYFSNRLAYYLGENGRRMMGWNEIMGKNIHTSLWDEADATQQLDNDVIMQFWEGDPAQIKEALENGYDVVNSDRHYTYLNYSNNWLTLEKTYKFTPVPDGLDPGFEGELLGPEYPLWGERLYTLADLYERAFPRLAAGAEVAWTKESNKDFERFKQSLDELKRVWDFKGIFYHKNDR